MAKIAGTYVWKGGSRLKANPILSGRYVERLCKKHGQTITPEILLAEDTKNKASPLRNEYEWNDGRAAHGYRLQQAGYILRSLCYVVQKDEDTSIEVRAFPVVGGDEGKPVFRPIEVVMSDPALKAQHIENAYHEFLVFKKRWQHLKELAELLEVGEKVFRKAV